MTSNAIGIDIGSDNLRAAVYRNGRIEDILDVQGNPATPAYVAFTETEILVGCAAKDQAQMNRSNTVYDIKYLIGRSFDDSIVQEGIGRWPFTVLRGADGLPKVQVKYRGNLRTFTPEYILAKLIGTIKDIAQRFLGQTVDQAVIAVPASFNPSQREGIRNAGATPDLNIHTISEADAAAIAFDQRKGNSERYVLFVSIDVGSVDVSILEIISDWEFKSTDVHTGYGAFEDQPKMLRLVQRVLEKAQLHKVQIDDILLVGDSTRIQEGRRMLVDLFSKEPNGSVASEKSNVHGAAFCAAIKSGDVSAVQKQQFKIGPLQIDRSQCFWRSSYCFAFVNLKPLVPGHVLVSPLRTATRLTELSNEETADLFVMAKNVKKMLESIYGTGKVTQFIVEDEGPRVVQTVKYVHMHVLPRMDNDFGNNLDLFNAVLQGHEGQGEARSADEMASEAMRYQQWLQKKSDGGGGNEYVN